MGDALHFILHERGKQTLQRLVDLLRKAQQDGWSRDDITTRIDETAPELSTLKDCLPTTRKELYIVLGIIISALSLVISSAQMGASKEEVKGYIDTAVQQAYQAQTQTQNQNVIVNVNQGESIQPHVGRNDPCPCGSGRKFKKCCGKGN